MVAIINRQRKHPLNRKRVQSLIERLANRYGLGDADVAVVFVGSRAIRTLNKTYRKKDAPTDVLSFPVGRRGPDGRFSLGDIVVSVPIAARQAKARGHALGREIEILVLHGFLHLAGFGHSAGPSSEERSLRSLLFGEHA
jgi:probable rRNA maturation factor